MTLRRARLERMRADAVARADAAAFALAALVHDRQGSNDDDEHDPDGVTLSSEWSRLSAMSDAAAEEVRLFDAALERWDAGVYGVCANCEKPIPEARLEARPFAVHCVACAEKLGR